MGNSRASREAYNEKRRLKRAEDKRQRIVENFSGYLETEDGYSSAVWRDVSDRESTEKVRLLEAECNRLKKLVVSETVVRNEIIKIVHTKPPIPRWLSDVGRFAKGSPGTPTLLVSDLHWGERVDPQQVGGVNEYNLDIAHRRTRLLINNTVDLLRNHMVNPHYPGIVMAIGGDMFSGDIHEELSRTNEEPIMPMVLDLYGVLIWCIQKMADEFGEIFVPCVTGNHSRTTMKPPSKNRNKLNFDWLLYKLLDKFFEKDERVTFYIPEGPDALYKVYSTRYLLTHGDQFRGGDGMIGALGPIIRGDHKKRSRNAQVGLEYDTLLLCHFHQLIQMQRLIVNGSLVGYSEYAHLGNFGFEPPRQALWITHPERGITFQMPVLVESSTKREKSREWVSVMKGSGR
jgi:hypothetical protein